MKPRVLGSLVVSMVVFVALVVAGPAAAMEVTSAGDSGGCTLRAAIEAVNTSNGGGVCGALETPTTTILLPAGHYTLTAGELSIGANAHLAIVGADPENPSQTVIDGGETSRVFEVAASARAILDGVEVTGGATLHGTDATAPEGFGVVGESGGGILNHGNLTLEHVLLIKNRTGRGGDGGDGATTPAHHNGGFANNGGNGGGIANESGALLEVRDSTISENRTGDGGQGGVGAHGMNGIGNIAAGGQGGIGGHSGDGAGIYNAGTLTITETTVSGNATGRNGAGGAGGQGADALKEVSPAGKGGSGGRGGNSGVLYESGTDTPGFAGEDGGGGIDNVGTLTMTDSTISANNTGAGGVGGGAGIGGARETMALEDGGTGGVGGSAGLGGGLLNVGTSMSLTNVTVSGNLTGDGGTGGSGAQSNSGGGGTGGFGGYGGGIWTWGPGKSGQQLTFVTIAGNHLGVEGQGGSDSEFPGFHGGPGKGGGIATGPDFGSGGGVTVTDSIVAGNAGENCNQLAPGGIVDGGHNVSYADATCPGTNRNPLLGSLADNGGPTATILPGAGSSAIGIASCPVSEDQRGFSRPGSGCDAGAVEVGGSGGGPVTTTTSLSTSGSPSTVGTAVTFTATVSPAPGGGTVEFDDGGSTIPGCGAKQVVSGQATCAETFPTAVSHTIVAEFSGTSGFDPSTSSILTQAVEAASSGGAGEPGGGAGTGSTPPAAGGSGSGSTGGNAVGPGSGSGGGSTGGKGGAGTAKVHGTTVSVPIACAGPSDVTCVIKVLLSAGASGGKGSPRIAARAKGAKKVTVGVASATIPGGATKTVTVSLNGVGKKMLAKAHSLKATLTVTQKGGSTPLLSRGVKFTANG
jgi:Bacterial Ig-like domain (group 3)